MKRLVLASLLVLGFAGPALAATTSEPRVALVIGNSAYATSPLKNPANDARLIAETLRALGFQVIEQIDANQKGMRRLLRDFGEALSDAGPDSVGLFYYSGHGVQVRGENFLIPTDAAIERESDVKIEAVSANEVLNTLSFADNRLNIVILDACRNNPYASAFKSPGRGLARMDAPRGTMVAYATAPGQVARDGEGANSPYTAALAAEMKKSGVPVEQMFKQARVTVMGETKDKQVPWESSSLTGSFYFNPAGVASAPAPTAPSPDTAATERLFWESIKDSDDPTMFEAYLEQYPEGTFTRLAKLKRDALAKATEAAKHKAARKAEEAKRKAAEEAERGRAAAEQAELAFWETIKDSDDPADYQAYVKTYPNGTFAVLARSRAERKAPPVTKVVQIRAAEDWQDSGVRARRGERYHLRATGTWSIGLPCGVTDASGAGVGFLCAGDPWGIGVKGSTLIGRIGDDGAPFRVGRELDLNATSDGVLFLRAYDNLPWDNSGAVTVRITELTPRQAASATKRVAALTPQQTGSFDGDWVLEIVEPNYIPKGVRVKTKIVDNEFKAPFSAGAWRGEISGKIGKTGTLVASGYFKRLRSSIRFLKFSTEFENGSFHAEVVSRILGQTRYDQTSETFRVHGSNPMTFRVTLKPSSAEPAPRTPN